MKNSKLKLTHARKLLINFASKYKIFIKENYQLITLEDKETGKYTVSIRIKNSVPEEWGADIGDIIHNTRATLDLLITDLLIANGNKPTKNSAFPVFETEKEFLKSGHNKVDGVKENALELIKRLKPFKGGDNKIWLLHQLDIIDKHRLIIPVVSENKAVVIDFGTRMAQMFGDDVGNVPSIPIGIRPAERAVFDGMTLFSADKTFSIPNFEFELTFGKGELLEGESISDTLNSFIILVERIIKEFESLLG